jgi:hypothetical protein
MKCLRLKRHEEMRNEQMQMRRVLFVLVTKVSTVAAIQRHAVHVTLK